MVGLSAKMRQETEEFIQYLKEKKHISENTAVSYRRDLKKLVQFLQTQGCDSIAQITVPSLNAYLLYLEKEGKKPSTIARNVVSARAFFQYLQKQGKLKQDLGEELKAPRIEKRMPQVLSMEEIGRAHV